jgi:hypothetical protein
MRAREDHQDRGSPRQKTLTATVQNKLHFPFIERAGVGRIFGHIPSSRKKFHSINQMFDK